MPHTADALPTNSRNSALRAHLFSKSCVSQGLAPSIVVAHGSPHTRCNTRRDVSTPAKPIRRLFAAYVQRATTGVAPANRTLEVTQLPDVLTFISLLAYILLAYFQPPPPLVSVIVLCILRVLYFLGLS
jgi:hypothetical protein